MATDYAFTQRVEELAEYRAGGDHLLTLAVPPDEPVGTTLEHVEEDAAEAEYLDSGSTDEARRRALERARHLLHDYEESGTPEHGLVAYVGVVDGDLVEETFDDLPSPVDEAEFVSGNEFDTEPLERTTGESRRYGLLVVERGGAALGYLDGDAVEHVETVDSQVMGKTKAGGQSAQRFERERRRQKEEFFDEVGEEAEREFLDGRSGAAGASGDAAASDGDGGDALPVDGLLVGGTTVTVDDFLDGDHLDYRLEDAVAGQYAVEYASERGLHQLVERAREELEAAEDRPARDALDAFFSALEDDSEPVAYGPEETREALEYGAVDTLLVSEALDADEIREFETAAEEEGGDLVVIPTGFDRGARFESAFGGVGALLRFEID
ncbi:Vms1/Ankzf1 family peptidyl-tRNA hydrolase [Halomicrobium salinisoli]|uniref:Vms1/Ankzf1 family peptidyl-tRNA hydrolase n=1 Tax=Halomicrobium salinisoli TaxID=2878391 RepID=UPI001CF0AB57|nr:Vms1/Ankzf1 family peptidyl-tRNA hydrolase [Halomicrobium salinisoli]